MNEASHTPSEPASATGPSRSVAIASAPGRPAVKRRRLALIGGLLAAAVVGYGIYYYIWSRTHESTDDAQAEGHVHAISSQVSGYVVELCVRDNQLVAAGDVLVRVRPEDYQARLTLAEGNLAQAEAGLTAAQRTVDVQRRSTTAAIDQARANVRQA